MSFLKAWTTMKNLFQLHDLNHVDEDMPPEWNLSPQPRRKKKKLFQLLDLNHDDEDERKTLDCDAVVKEIQKDPQSAEMVYKFSHGEIHFCYPLHKAIKLGAPIKVIDALCNNQALSERGEDGYTVLHLALEKRSSVDVVELLLCKRPALIRQKYRSETPLHLACKCRSTLDVVFFLVAAWPGALREKNLWHDSLPLHMACMYGASLEVVSFLVSAWPESTKEMTDDGSTALHYALFSSSSPSEVASFLFDCWPDAVLEKNFAGDTPLNVACRRGAPVGLVSRILDSWPDAIREKSRDGSTPLHSALEFLTKPHLEVVQLLLEKWPAATKEKDIEGRTPFEIAQNKVAQEEICMTLFVISTFYDDEIDNPPSPNEAIKFFTNLEWWNGIALVIDRYHVLPQSLNLPTTVMPTFLSVVGRSCKLKTLWEMLRNEQDLFSDNALC